MNLEQLRYFVDVADEESFTKAAQRSFITKNGLTYQIKQMERELGFDLFERDSHHVALTRRGSVLLPAAREMLASWDRALDRALKDAPDEARILDVGMADFMDKELLGRVDRELKRFVPGAVVRPHYATPLNPSIFLADLGRGLLDVAFMGEREAGISPSLTFEPLCAMRYGLYVAPNHELAQKDHVVWHDLDGRTVVLLSGIRMPENRALGDDADRLFRERCPDVVLIYASCFEEEEYIVEHEGAVGVLPFTCREEMGTRRLAFRVIEDAEEVFGIVYPTAPENALLAFYLQACREAWGQDDGRNEGVDGA